jgi:hypothetical protein
MFRLDYVAVSFVYRLSSCVNFTSFFYIKLFFFSTLLNIKLLKYINFNLVKFYAENIKQNWDEKKGRNYVKLEYLDTTVKNMYFYLLDHFCQYQ